MAETEETELKEPEIKEPELKPISLPAALTVGELAQHLNISVAELMTALMKNGVMATINETLDLETASIISAEFGFEAVAEEVSEEIEPEKQASIWQRTVLEAGAGEPRAPIVAVMGHVDHGKTTLLDAIRGTSVANGEAGGITQHLSAYQITFKDRPITFLDTPGHEAFSILRRHGARLTDVAIIVVAADDGIKPQTKEAIDFARQAGVKMIVAINKIDKPGADLNQTKQQLSEVGLQPEEWGGETVTVEISAKEKTNIDKLLELVLLVTDIEDLRARPDGVAEGTVIESHMERGKGSVATLLVEHGRLKKGDFVAVGDSYGRIRSLESSDGKALESAGPATPVEISGIKSLPTFGQLFRVAPNEKAARELSAQNAIFAPQVRKATKHDELMVAIAKEKIKRLPLIVKADVQGTLESLLQAMNEIGNEEVRTKIVSSAVGNINESDVTLAESTGALIIGFNVSMPVRIKQVADQAHVEVLLHNVIYELTEEIGRRLTDLLEVEEIETIVGKLELKGVFRITQKMIICGGVVKEGHVEAGLGVRWLKDEPEEIGNVDSVQKEQQVVKSVKEGSLCGLNIKTSSKANLKIGDLIEFYKRETKTRSL